MSAPVVNEAQLRDDIDALRGRFAETPDLYREVCTLLFFRYGVTPTANKLYQLVHKGSMTAPVDALSRFWETLREKSRVRIEQPDLPDEIKSAAGELAASLWTLAQDKAVASLRAVEAEAKASVVEAHAARDAAVAERERLQGALAQSRSELDRAANEIISVRQELVAERKAQEALAAKLARAESEIAAQRQANERARLQFAAELEKLSAAAQLSEERFHAAEKRALMEVDHERSAAGRLLKEIEAARQDAARTVDRHRAELAELLHQLGELRQKMGSLEGQLKAVTGSRDHFEQEMKAAQNRMGETSAKAAVLLAEVDNWKSRAERAERTLEERTGTKRRKDKKFPKRPVKNANSGKDG